MKIQQKISLFTAVTALTLDFLYLIIQHAVSDRLLPIDPIHTTAIIIGFAALCMYLLKRRSHGSPTPMQEMGRSVIAVTAVLLLLGTAQLSHIGTLPEGTTPHSLGTADMVTAALLSIAASVASLIIFISLSGMVFVRHRARTRRNYYIMLGVLAVYMIFEYLSSPSGMAIGALLSFRHIAYGFLIVLMVINSFRFSWILDVSRREKLILLLLSFFGFVFFLIFALFSAQETPLADALLRYHPLLYGFVRAVSLFGTLYLGVGFASTLMHLPTAKEFDRKKLEISSLQNMSRLITQVFDFDELVATTTYLALEVSEGSAAWLELAERYTRQVEDGGVRVVTNSMRNITDAQISSFRLTDGKPLQSLALETGKPVLVADLTSDKRIDQSRILKRDIGSLAIIPLNSHGGIIGVLCVAKKSSFEFDRDSTNVLYAFADMVAVALENSHLIHESIVKERLEQELLVAQKMQRSLLPQRLPASPQYEISARSVPAYEVGGDYYDVVQLDSHHLGFIVGDVSGKGVSAALYMAQVKGVFQSLGNAVSSTREILVRMNTPLCLGMEKKSFISMLYAVLDTRTGVLTFSRAGHCPLLHVADGKARYLQPSGMALGLELSTRFADSLEEESLVLKSGDTVVMYTDGVTEARDPAGNEFQYDRLAAIVESSARGSAEDVLDGIVSAVHRHTASGHAEDDVTLLVLHWKGTDLNNDEKQIH